MELKQAMQKRTSIRGYLDTPVPQEILRQILELGGRAVSAVNVQPWEFLVVTGETLERLRAANQEDFYSGREPDYGSFVPDGVYKDRARTLGKGLFQLMGIAREDVDKRIRWNERGYRFFDAPAVILLVMDSALDESTFRFDMGCAAQSICLAAMEFGLGTCVEEQAITYHRGIREILGVPESKRPVIGIAVGYPDPAFPANQMVSQREPVDQITSWYF